MKKKRKKIRVKIVPDKIQAKKNRQRGKTNEKDICKLLGFDRVGIFGGEDGKLGPISLEIKSREKYAGDTMFYGQTETNRKKAGRKVSLLIVHLHGKQHKNDLVHIRLEDWQKLFECAKKAGYVKKISRN